ncbi:placenta-specific gene 8 protein-like [Physella acuta]|uniref:placenta-specific gene 8 protein-like n=1 Tax=Physella acuta TaxID=109671 RepID=UPI0027DBC5C9|nr:placenta-specific gene 8 protein-like [Physella acuta]
MSYIHQQPISMNQNSSNVNTVVVNSQPAPIVKQPREWGTGLCQCFDDCVICMCGTFCLVCLSMKTASEMDESMCVPCCVPGGGVAMRVKIRTQENIYGSICNDCLLETFCGPCSQCQLAREVKHIRQGRNTRAI